MTANGDKSETVSPASSEASSGTTAAMDESLNGGAEAAAAATVAAMTVTAATTPSAEDTADAAAFKEAANKDFKGMRSMSFRGNAGQRRRERRLGGGEKERKRRADGSFFGNGDRRHHFDLGLLLVHFPSLTPPTNSLFLSPTNQPTNQK